MVADQLRNGAKLDNGDNSEVGAMFFMLAKLSKNSDRDGMSEEFIDRFEYDLFSLIMKKNPTHIVVDYHPDWILREAVESSGVKVVMGSFPWKTEMYFSDDGVQVSCGYRAELKYI